MLSVSEVLIWRVNSDSSNLSMTGGPTRHPLTPWCIWKKFPFNQRNLQQSARQNLYDKLHSCLNLSFALILLFHCKMRYFASYYLKNTFQHLCYQVKILENCYFFWLSKLVSPYLAFGNYHKKFGSNQYQYIHHNPKREKHVLPTNWYFALKIIILGIRLN